VYIKIKDYDLSLAIVNGTGDAKKILDKIKDGKQYDIVEVMACEGGCISGGGNSKKYMPITADIKKKRMNSVYKIDNKSKRRSSYQNKVLKGIYFNYIGVPYGDVAKELLHVKH
jgi:iron only hydrogenase large subunit-like protein